MRINNPLSARKVVRAWILHADVFHIADFQTENPQNRKITKNEKINLKKVLHYGNFSRHQQQPFEHSL